jgi:DNA-binding XRE family transcriptional regulator
VTTDYLLRDTLPADSPIAAATIPLPEGKLSQFFGAQLRRLRAQHSMTQVDLARHLGAASQGHVSLLESGRKTPSIDLVLQCADLFGVTTDYLLRDTALTRM